MVIDNSLARPWLNRVYFEPILRFTPHFISPNAITLSGLMACVGMIAVLRGWDAPGVVLSLVCGLAVHYYTIADQIDGMQARKLDRKTELGAFLDHACDFINGQIIIWASLELIGASWFWLIVTSSAYSIAFIASHFEHRKSGDLYFGAIGPLEALLIASVVFLVYSLAPAALTTPMFGWFTGGRAVIVFYIVGFAWNTLSVYLRMRAKFFTACGVPIITVCLLGATALWSSTAAPLFWLIQLSCGAIYSLRSLYAPSIAVRSLPVFPMAILSLIIVTATKFRIIQPSIEYSAAYLILGYSLLLLLVVVADIYRFFSSASRRRRAPVAMA